MCWTLSKLAATSRLPNSCLEWPALSHSTTGALFTARTSTALAALCVSLCVSCCVSLSLSLCPFPCVYALQMHCLEQRRLLVIECIAAYAWPLVDAVDDPAFYQTQALFGEPISMAPRLEVAPVRLPFPRKPTGSIYEAQLDIKHQAFSRI